MASMLVIKVLVLPLSKKKLTTFMFFFLDFYVHLIDGAEVSKDLTSSTNLLTSKKIPTVMHFYDGG
jgi:hypothetical protein